MSNELFVRKIHYSKFPKSWQCPTCKIGSLVKNIKTFTEKETERTIDGQNHPEWEPEWTDGRIFGTLVCSNPNCREEVVFCGNYTLEEHYDEYIDLCTWDSFYWPKYFYPPIPLFLLPEELPEKVVKEIESSFALYWCDLQGCANKIRSCLEIILDVLKVQKMTKAVKGKKVVELSLHQRIGLLKAKRKEAADFMLAIKWIGNSGSHGDKITEDDIQHGFQLLAAVIDNVFDKKSKTLIKTAKKIIKHKKPISHLTRNKGKKRS